MAKSYDERLFELLMRAPHAVRRSLMSGMQEDGVERCRHGHCHGHGHDHGHRPHAAFARERLLRIIGEHEGGVRQKTLVALQHISPSSVSELITRLEDDGYVRRTVDPDDKRATLISLTDLGAARAAELEDERRDRFAGAFKKLGEEEKAALVGLLEKLLEDETATA